MAQVQPAGHWLYQLAQIFLLLSYLTTNLIALRSMLACAALCFTLWGALVLDISVDTTVWNALFFVINTIQTLLLLFKKRPIKFKFAPHEDIYREMFEKVGISRHDFRIMADMGLLRSLKAGSFYIEAGNVVNNLSLLYKGKLELYHHEYNRQSQTSTVCHEWEFVESPEWAARNNRRAATPSSPQHSKAAKDESGLLEFQDAETIKVSAKAVEHCLFLSWPVEQLEAYISAHSHVAAPLNALIGADIAKKLFRQHPHFKTPSDFTPDEQFLYDLFKQHVSNFNKVDAAELLTASRKGSYRLPGTVFVRAGEEASQLAVLRTGEIEVVLGEGAEEKILYTIRPPQFLGAVEFETEGHIARLGLRARTPCSFNYWDVTTLRGLCESHEGIHHALSAVLAADLSSKMSYALYPKPLLPSTMKFSQPADEVREHKQEAETPSSYSGEDNEFVLTVHHASEDVPFSGRQP